MRSPELDGHVLAAQYEELRTWALAPDAALPRPHGLALLIQHGLPAWMQALARWMPAWPSVPARHGDSTPALVPAVGPAVVVLLTNMALAGWEETRC